MVDIPDAPWIGHCEEEYEEMCFPDYYDEDRDNYEIEQAEREERDGQNE